MAGGDLKLKYPVTSVVPTVTNLQSLAASQTLVAGWGSASVNNTSNVYRDYLYGGTLTSHASNRQAGTIAIYAVAALNDTPTWPAVSSGTLGSEGAIAFADVYRLRSLTRLLISWDVDSSASAIYTFPPLGIRSLFGEIPPYHCLFITHNISTTTTAGFASSANAVYYTPTIDQYT
jgi:hypothetical protein